MSKEHIEIAQAKLKQAGFYDGFIDGKFGKASLDAVNDAIKAAGYKAPVLPAGYVTEHFSMSELTHSNTAVSRGISNVPSAEHKQNLIDAAINLFQPVRELLAAPMIVSSGYRSPAVNRAVGGSSTSAHSLGYAIDFIAPRYGDTTKIAKFLIEQFTTKGIKFDQLILEFPDSPNSWIHLGYKNGAGQQRAKVLTAKKVGGRTKYFVGLA